MDPYLSPALHADTQDTFFARSAIRDALRAHLDRFEGTFLDIGCGSQPYRRLITQPPSRVARYVGLDLRQVENGPPAYAPADVEWDGARMPFATDSVDCAMATEVLEHCPDPLVVLREAHRVIRPGGSLFVTVPFLWPLHDTPHDHYRYTTFALERMLAVAGFSAIDVRPLGGWDASLAQMIGLWVLRRPMSRWRRRVLKRVALPVVRELLKRDTIPDPRDAPMITGVAAIAGA